MHHDIQSIPLLWNRPTWSARVRRRWSRACTISSLSSCRSRRPIRSGPRRTPWRSLLFTALLASDALIQGDGEALSLALSEFEPRVVGILTSACCARRQLTFCDMGIVWQSQQDAFAQRFTAPRTSRGCRSAVQRALLT